MTVEERCDFKNVKFHKTLYVGNVCDVWTGISVNPCVFRTPLSLCKMSRISMYFNHPRLKCRTSKLVSSVLAAHRARWHGGTYAKLTLLGGDG